MNIESANLSDASDLAYLINLAGEGIPEFLWSEMAEENETPLEVGKRRASREEGGFSYRNARIIRQKGFVAGMIISYQLDDPYTLESIEEYPEVIRPLVLLESEAPGSWYINAIATNEDLRGQGIASCLMSEAEAFAKSNSVDCMSLIVASENESAKSLYLTLGYERVSSLPVVAYPSSIHGGDWDLMIKKLNNA